MLCFAYILYRFFLSLPLRIKIFFMTIINTFGFLHSHPVLYKLKEKNSISTCTSFGENGHTVILMHINCSSFPSSQSLCLLPLSYVYHLPMSDTSTLQHNHLHSLPSQHIKPLYTWYIADNQCISCTSIICSI